MKRSPQHSVPQDALPSRGSGLVGPDGQEVESTPPETGGPSDDLPSGVSEASIEMGVGRGKVYVRLPTGKTIELSPETAKRIGGDLLNSSRKAASQREKIKREASQ